MVIRISALDNRSVFNDYYHMQIVLLLIQAYNLLWIVHQNGYQLPTVASTLILNLDNALYRWYLNTGFICHYLLIKYISEILPFYLFCLAIIDWEEVLPLNLNCCSLRFVYSPYYNESIIPDCWWGTLFLSPFRVFIVTALISTIFSGINRLVQRHESLHTWRGLFHMQYRCEKSLYTFILYNYTKIKEDKKVQLIANERRNLGVFIWIHIFQMHIINVHLCSYCSRPSRAVYVSCCPGLPDSWYHGKNARSGWTRAFNDSLLSYPLLQLKIQYSCLLFFGTSSFRWHLNCVIIVVCLDYSSIVYIRRKYPKFLLSFAINLIFLFFV